MRAYVINRFGKPDVFEEMQLARPTAAPGTVLIRVAATSVNPIDTKIRAGLVPNLAPSFPAVLHGDVAGIIEEVGPGVTDLQVGDEVYACAGNGALADYLLAPAALVAKKPASLSFQEAAALPLVTITAWEALFDRLNLQSGQHILIHAGTGGVGHVAIQLAKSAGAVVYTTVSTAEKEKLALELGADAVINYRNETVEEYVAKHTGGHGFDLVFDTVGGTNLDRSFAAVKTGGAVAAIAARSTHDLTPLHNKGLTLHVVFMILPLLSGKGLERHGQILRELTRLVDQGKVKPLLDASSFAYRDIAQAHERLESGQAVGKITLLNDRFSL
ncbi:zinc-dependent alcohol dehydrogenase family protein [Laceyella putida]|uniref:Zinc-dependent alcohol dehydrogenase family protein n=1 Tax=Laceyella putida TaxID=110101 RepID=A0ABW2RPK9_9BACL